MNEEILKNAQGLLDTALLLQKEGKYLHAAHFGVLALEEATKCLMDLEPIKKLFSDKKLYSHEAKSNLIGVFHYISGGVSVVYCLQQAKEEGFFGGTNEQQQLVIDDCLEFTGVKDAESLARVVQKNLELNNTEPFKSGVLKRYDNIRKHSVYCDYDQGILHLPKDRVSEDNAIEVIDDAKLAVSLLTMIYHEKFDFNTFIQNHPSRHEDIKLKAEELISKLKNKK